MEAIAMKEGLLSRREFLQISSRAGLAAIAFTLGETTLFPRPGGAVLPGLGRSTWRPERRM
jgi:hypothetical protein